MANGSKPYDTIGKPALYRADKLALEGKYEAAHAEIVLASKKGGVSAMDVANVLSPEALAGLREWFKSKKGPS